MSQAQPGQLVFPDRHSLQAGLCWSTSTRAWRSGEREIKQQSYKLGKWAYSDLGKLFKIHPRNSLWKQLSFFAPGRVAFCVKDATRAGSEEGRLFSQAILETTEKNINQLIFTRSMNSGCSDILGELQIISIVGTVLSKKNHQSLCLTRTHLIPSNLTLTVWCLQVNRQMPLCCFVVHVCKI